MRLDSASSAPWQNLRRSELRPARGNQRLHWVILLAIFCSLGLHVLMIVAFGDIRVYLPRWHQATAMFFHVPRLSVPESAIHPPPDTDRSSKLDPDNIPEVFDEKKLDITDLQTHILDDRDISITPDVKKPENIAAGAAAFEAPSVIGPDTLEPTLAPLVKGSLSATDIPAGVSDNQPVLLADTDGAEAGKTNDLLQKAAKGNQGTTDNFSTIDDMLGIPGGKITDITKPIYMPSDLLFDFKEDRLRESAKTSLMMLGVLIDRNPDTIFVIEGHTDTIGSDASNLDLSRRRALAVANWLQQSLRIAPERIQTAGLGESRPLVAPDGTPDQQQPNRRVEIHMLRPGKAAQDAPATPAAEPTVRPARAVEP